MKKALVQFIVSINAIVLIQTAYGDLFPFWQGGIVHAKPDIKVAIAINVDADNQTIQQAVAAGVAQALADYMKKKKDNKKK